MTKTDGEKTPRGPIERIKTAKSAARGYAKNLLKERKPQNEDHKIKESEERRVFSELSPEEQEAQILKIASLSAELKDIARSQQEHRGEKESPQTTVTKLAGGLRIRIPASSSEKNTATIFWEAAKQKAQDRKQEIIKELEKIGRITGIETAYANRIARYFILREVQGKIEELKTENEEIEAEIEAILQKAQQGDQGTVVGIDAETIRLLREKQQKNLKLINKEISNTDGSEKNEVEKQTSYEHLVVARLQQLQEYQEAFSANRLIEIPTIAKIRREGLQHLRNNQPFLLAGHLGSGKTELAKHIAKIFMLEHMDTIEGVEFSEAELADPNILYEKMQPEFFSGADEASVYDLVGKLKLKASATLDPKELKEHVQKTKDALANIGIKDIQDQEIAKILIGKQDITETVFNYGPLGRAIKRGVPIIIDEINMVPPEIMSRINDLLLRQKGTQVTLQENGEEPLTIKPGFAVIATCNLGAQYAGIREVNAAFKSRWVSREVSYPTAEETYELILAALLRKDRPRLPTNFPEHGLEKITDLAIVTKEIQNLFSGETEGKRYMGMGSGATVSGERTQLKKAVISPRDLMRKIILPWKNGNFSESLDTIIARNIIASEVFSVNDQKFITELFIRMGFFTDWNAETFKNAGIQSVSEGEIKGLKGAMAQDAYTTDAENVRIAELRGKGKQALLRDTGNGISQALLIGAR